MIGFLSRAVGLGVVLAAGVSAAQAGVIGNWDGSGRSWNSGPQLVSVMQGRGHTVEADGALTAANLAGDTLFVIGEATRTTTAQETADLSAWVNGGGRLLVTVDSGGLGAANGNAILAAIGSSISFGGSAVNGALQTGNFLSDGGPFNIVGSSLQVTPGTGVSGGTALAGSYVAFEALGSGFVFGFGDHFQNTFFNNSAATVNGQMHINLVESKATVDPIPLPAPVAMLAAVIAGAGFIARRQAKA